MDRELYDLDWWIRVTLRDFGSVEKVRAHMDEALAQNAVELGYVQRADGSWRFAGEWTWGPGVTVIEKVPHAAIYPPDPYPDTPRIDARQGEGG